MLKKASIYAGRIRRVHITGKHVDHKCYCKSECRLLSPTGRTAQAKEALSKTTFSYISRRRANSTVTPQAPAARVSQDSQRTGHLSMLI